jgi:hypothetical protein
MAPMQLKEGERTQILALGIFAGMMMAFVVAGNTASAASQAEGSGCSLSFDGSLVSFDMSPAGSWTVASSDCSVTGRSNGVTSGTFTGSFTSDVFSGRVSGTWSVAGSTQSVVASSTAFTLSISSDQVFGQVPVLGSSFQGILSGDGSSGMFAVETVGQVAIG